MLPQYHKPPYQKEGSAVAEHVVVDVYVEDLGEGAE